MRAADIMHETNSHWVRRIKTGFEVYKKGITHSTRCAQIGYTGTIGLDKAITECNKRSIEQ